MLAPMKIFFIITFFFLQSIVTDFRVAYYKQSFILGELDKLYVNQDSIH